MNFSEKDIQNYIWENRADWESLIEPLEIPKPYQFADDLSDLTPKFLLHNQALERLEAIYDLILELEFLGCEVPLEKASNSTIRADFLALPLRKTSIVVIELKKSCQTERQAFTELLAYSNHITNLFPGMCKEDVTYVLISPMDTRIVREAFLQTLIFDKRPICALVPKLSDESDISTLKLFPWIPSLGDIVSFTQVAFHPCNLDVCKVVWEYSEEVWDAPPHSSTDDRLINQLNYVASMAAQAMEQQGIHGFAYCSQLWSELSESLPFTNSLVVVGLNPYAIASSMYSRETGREEEDSGFYTRYIPQISKIISGLSKSSSAESHLDDPLSYLHRGWRDHLFEIAFKAVKLATKTTDGSLHIDYGSMTWAEYQLLPMEDVYCTNCAAHPTGSVRDLFWQVVNIDYDVAAKVGVDNHPVHDDMFYSAIETLKNNWTFREFIDRMFGENPNVEFYPTSSNFQAYNGNDSCSESPF